MLAFLDTETTGLDPDYHEVWEVAIQRQPEGGSVEPDINRWTFPPRHLERADAMALTIGGFYERMPNPSLRWRDEDLADVAAEIATLLSGATIVGCNPSFDAAFLRRFLRDNGQAPAWNYHLLDIETMALGYLAFRGDDDARQHDWSSKALSRAIGVNPDDFDRHTAAGDVKWVRAMYEQIVNQRG